MKTNNLMEHINIPNIDNLLKVNITYKSPLLKVNENEKEENKKYKKPINETKINY